MPNYRLEFCSTPEEADRELNDAPGMSGDDGSPLYEARTAYLCRYMGVGDSSEFGHFTPKEKYWVTLSAFVAGFWKNHRKRA